MQYLSKNLHLAEIGNVAAKLMQTCSQSCTGWMDGFPYVDSLLVGDSPRLVLVTHADLRQFILPPRATSCIQSQY